MGTVSTEALPTMNSLTLTTLLCALTASAWVPTAVLAQEAPPSKPLDLSLPREALSGTWGAAAREDAQGLPDLGGNPAFLPVPPALGAVAGLAETCPTAPVTRPGMARAVAGEDAA